ncbi:MAG: DNA repair protein RecO [Bacteroidales bacterium]|nr:DNA repair protein RecO [Bacteroidales bacterium]MCB8998729.1 DNA repair protein RecO [Bacteroidales bacterium]
MALSTTQGIVLQQTKFGDSSIICQIFTLDHGRHSFLFKGIRSKKSKIHSNILQALSIINLSAYVKESKDISLVKEASPAIIFTHFPYDINKSAQAMFMAELMNKCLREEEANPQLYSFIINSLQYFDLLENSSSNFHIFFLVKLSKFLGFYPLSKSSPGERFFDMKDGNYKNSFPLHSDYFDLENSDILEEIVNKNYDQLSTMVLNQQKRNDLLESVLKFYSIHIEGISRLKSFAILRELFS